MLQRTRLASVPFIFLGLLSSSASAGIDTQMGPRCALGDNIEQQFRQKFVTHLSNPLPTNAALASSFDIIDHDTFWEINSLDPSVFESAELDDELSNEMMNAVDDWYGVTGDDPDFLVIYKGWGPEEYYAFYSPVSNDVRGIGYKRAYGVETFDQSPESKLQGFIYMSALDQYAQGNFTATMLGAFFGQEIGHRWGSFVYFDQGGIARKTLLGRDDAHWSYFVDSDWSWMEGNDWAEESAGRFKTQNISFEKALGYSQLDLYIMGLIPPSAVDPFLLIDQPKGTTRRAGDPPEEPIGNGSVVTVGGTKTQVTIDDIVKAEGVRLPEWTKAPRRFRVAMIVLSKAGQPLSASRIQQATEYADLMVSGFAKDTRNLASIDLSTKLPTPNQAPTAALSIAESAKAGSDVEIDATGTKDPEGDGLAYTVDFGDGHGGVTETGRISHKFDTEGTYSVTLLAVDRFGNKATAVSDIRITKGEEGGSGCGCTLNGSRGGSRANIGTLIGSLFLAISILVRRRRS